MTRPFRNETELSDYMRRSERWGRAPHGAIIDTGGGTIAHVRHEWAPHATGAPILRRVAGSTSAHIPERDVLAACLDLLPYHPKVAWFARMNSGGMERTNADGTKRYVSFAFVGCSDIIGQLKDGRFFCCECKSTTGALTDEQARFFERVRQGNGVAILARDPIDLAKGLLDA